MLYEPDEEFSLSSWFGTVAEDVRQQYFRYWEQVESAHTPEVAPEDRLAWTHLINLSRGLRRGIDSLAFDAATVDEAKRMLTFLGQDGASDWVAAAWTASLRDNPVVKHGILIELASEAADTLLAGAEQRVLFLTELVAQRVMSERARAFLERATRLYLWGFEPECVVMCACSLEAAYPERFSDLDMFGLQIKKHERRSSTPLTTLAADKRGGGSGCGASPSSSVRFGEAPQPHFMGALAAEAHVIWTRYDILAAEEITSPY
jgi:hypothetical protein